MDKREILCECCDQPFVPDGVETLCPTCIEYAEQCDECGSWHLASAMTDVSNSSDDTPIWVCADCLEDNYTVCDHCGEWSRMEDAVWVEDESVLYCEDCANDELSRCDSCGRAFNPRNSGMTDGHLAICSGCEDEFSICEECDHIVPRDEAYYDEYSDRWLCSECYENEAVGECDTTIETYSYKPEASFQYTDDDASPRLYFGVELEYSFPIWRNRNEFVDAITMDTDGVLYFKEDSSLDHGVEIVSHPCTLNWWHGDYARDMVDDIMRSRSDNDHLSDRRDDGMHVHVSRGGMTPYHEQRFISMFNGLWRFVIALSGRAPNGFAKFARDTSDFYEHLDGTYRYRCVNRQNKKTLEVRIFHTPTTAHEFYSRLELVHAVYQYTKNLDCNELLASQTLRYMDTDMYSDTDRIVAWFSQEDSSIVLRDFLTWLQSDNRHLRYAALYAAILGKSEYMDDIIASRPAQQQAI